MQTSTVVEGVAVLDAVPEYSVPAGHDTSSPLYLRDIARVKILVKISRWIVKERIAELCGIRKLILERRAPRLCKLVVLAAWTKLARVAITAAFPADERIGKPIIVTPVPKPSKTDPVQMEVPEKLIGNVEHMG